MRGHSSDGSNWMDLHELQEMQDALELDKTVGTELLAAVRDEDLQYVTTGDLTQERTLIHHCSMEVIPLDPS